MKKVLILTVTAGNGHNSAANAMKNKLEQIGGVEVKVVDIIKKYTSKFNSWIVDKGYNIAAGYLGGLYNVFYDSYMNYPVDKASVCPPQFSVKDLNGELLKLIYEFKPDVIYTTTYYGGMALTNLRRVFPLPSVNIACMLDYVVSPFWEASIGGIDYLTLAHEENRQVLLDKGFLNKNLITTGIPVGDKFSVDIDKIKAREMLGMDKTLFTVLILFGGGHWHGGYEILHALLKKIKRNIQIVVANGHNKKAKEKIDSEMKFYPKNFKIVNLGFTDKIDVYMSASDVMVGKGGGLSVTEAINKGLPLISTAHLLRQEYYNIKFLKDRGLGFTFSNYKELAMRLNDLYENYGKLDEIRKGLDGLKTSAIEDIAKLIMEQPKADYSKIDTASIDYGKVNKMVNKGRKKAWKVNKHKKKK